MASSVLPPKNLLRRDGGVLDRTCVPDIRSDFHHDRGGNHLGAYKTT